MGALTDLFKSERGFFALALTLASTVLVALGHMPIEMWKEMNLYIYGIYVGGKSLTGAVGLYKGTLGADSAVEPVPAPAPAPAPASTSTPEPTK